MRTGVALGANLGDRLATLRAARERIEGLRDLAGPWFSSAIYETEPVGCEHGAHAFLNACVEFEFEGEPQILLDQLRAIEATFGRGLLHPPNESRTIDLDLLYCGERRSAAAGLELPHPRLAQRRFVLQPLADIRPDLILPGQSNSIAELLANLPSAPVVVRFREQW